MFREMRRFGQKLSDDETTEILTKGKTGVLAVLGDDGYPYTVPINYVYTGGRIYFHGAKQGHKYDALERCDKVSLCVVDKDDVYPDKLTTYFKSVVTFGRARVLTDDDEIIHAAKLLGAKYGCEPEKTEKEIQSELKRLCCFEIVIEHMTGKEGIELTRLRNNK